MSLTLVVKSTANSWKMSTVGQVLWKRKLMGPWARTMVGKPRAVVAAAAPPAAALPKNFRRPSAALTPDAIRVLESPLITTSPLIDFGSLTSRGDTRRDALECRPRK